MKKLFSLVNILFIFLIIFWIGSTQAKTVSAAGSFGGGTCPQATDTGAFTHVETDGTIRCYSASGGLGYNTIGLKQTCGPVVCPLQWLYGGLKRGNTCVKKDKNNDCHPGTIASGFFDVDADPNTCHVSDPNVKVPCPAPIPLYIKIIDAKGDPVPDATVRILYEDAPPFDAKGKSIDVNSGSGNAKGIITVAGKLYSGDHFTIIPQQANYRFDPPQYGDTNVLMKMQMNTTYSCGQNIANPCTFTVERADTGIAGSFTASTFLVLAGILLVALLVRYFTR